MPTNEPESLPTLDPAMLAHVTGGTGDDLSSMLPLLMMKKPAAQPAPQAAPAPTLASWTPKITVDGVPQQATSSDNGSTFTTSSDA